MPMDEAVKKTGKNDLVSGIWDILTSLKLVVILLLMLSALSIAGTIIEQNKPLKEYYRFYERGTVALFSKLGLFDMYHSWWFIACLTLLALNIAACTMSRYRGIIAGMKHNHLILDQKLSKSLRNVAAMRLDLSRDAAEKEILKRARKYFSGQPVITMTDDGEKHYFFEKGKYSRLAFFMTHLSILIIFFGALAGSLWGYKGYVNILEGDAVSRVSNAAGKIQQLDFQVKCNSFDAEFYPGGTPRDYRSDLSVIQNGREVVRKTIRVNDPLTFGGITFFQSSYGALPHQATIDVMNRDGSRKGTLIMPFDRKGVIPGTADQVELVDYVEHYPQPDGREGGPAVALNILHAKGGAKELWISADHSGDRQYGSDYFFRLKDLQMKKYTGLQVNKDPGEILVWLGSLLLIAGIMVAFFLSHKKLWIALRTDKQGQIELRMGGTSNKNRDIFAREVQQFVQSLKEISR